MNQFTIDIAQALVKKEDITNVFRSHLEAAVNLLLATELTAFLDYDKYDRAGFNSGNSRNGSYNRTLRTEFGELQLTIPRDRNGEFDQQTVAVHMFQKGVTMSEIADLIERMFGHHYTPQTVSNMARAVGEQVEAFKARQLASRYVCVYLDATYIALKRDTVSKEAVYLAIGIREDGSKEVLAYTIAPTESAYVWKEVLQDLKERGTEEILLFVTDGLKGITDCIASVYPDAKYQACHVHVSRNIAHKMRVQDRAEICGDYKAVYRSEDREKAADALAAFIAKWKTAYPRVTKALTDNAHLLTFYDFPAAIWPSIYSTNLIESFNKEIKKYSRRKEQFPNEDSLDRFLVSRFETYNQKHATSCHRGFNSTRAELVAMFKQTEQPTT